MEVRKPLHHENPSAASSEARPEHGLQPRRWTGRIRKPVRPLQVNPRLRSYVNKLRGGVGCCFGQKAYPTQDWPGIRDACRSGIKPRSDWSKIWTQQPIMTQYWPIAGCQWYKLYTFLITDGMGTGRPVMYSFVESEQFAPKRRLFGLFEEMMGEQHPVRTFVMDKLAAQMRAASVVFGCDVRLCYFHIRKAIKKRITRKWAVHAQSGMVHFGTVTNSRLENANGRLKDRVHHADTLEHAIQKVSRHAEWLVREIEMHTLYHCDRRQILEGEGYILNVVCRMTTYACSLVLRHLGPRPPRLPCDSVSTNKYMLRRVHGRVLSSPIYWVVNNAKEEFSVCVCVNSTGSQYYRMVSFDTSAADWEHFCAHATRSIRKTRDKVYYGQGIRQHISGGTVMIRRQPYEDIF
ncbi:hypothetical protein CLF_107837 [Clonorchis sinensis]|uniref:ZSWIM1/3 RNaseH-like domain-containing protein n=1 Tax=Clonorchis sinensis TaxID=79923 RepID=G7YR23_CLOSI|nr:hypothetical protein CLF_107837 [Clonorchis sinensis]